MERDDLVKVYAQKAAVNDVEKEFKKLEEEENIKYQKAKEYFEILKQEEEDKYLTTVD